MGVCGRVLGILKVMGICGRGGGIVWVHMTWVEVSGRSMWYGVRTIVWTGTCTKSGVGGRGLGEDGRGREKGGSSR